jgi:hypothetical protein
MTGEIPTEIGNLVNLWQLELYNNSFMGKLPASFRNLKKLENFDASENLLVGDLSELRFSTNLVSLQLYKNNLTGLLPYLQRFRIAERHDSTDKITSKIIQTQT